MERNSFQGISNIIRFNWHFYAIAGIVLVASLLLSRSSFFPEPIQRLLFFGSILAIGTMMISLVVSYYIYDRSGLYELDWLNDFEPESILNLHAGFDETSLLLQHKFPQSDLRICDFYDPKTHTEVSIKRARKAYPPDKATIAVQTDHLPFSDNSFDLSLAILSAHEVRDREERIQLFKELNRITKASGHIIVTEHLRDRNNFLAYTIGFFHFHSKASWMHTFKGAGLSVRRAFKFTPFITHFILQPHGNTS